MLVEQLLRYDIPQAVVSIWEDHGCSTLLPLQEQVLRRHDLFGRGNLLIQAPTSSGKTFVGEMAAIHTALRQKQVIYLVPLKALAEEKYQAFQRKYRDYGLKIILSTRDHREQDSDLERGDFSIAVVVYEKLAQLLVRHPERVTELDLVVADELEILGDPERGACAELLLTRLLVAQCRLIGLSAVIGGVERLATWMDADLVLSEKRPVPLRYGVLCEGEFRYRRSDTGERGQESLVDEGTDSIEAAALANVAAFAEKGERTLIFVRAKHDTRIGADRIAARLELPPASEAIAALSALEATRSQEALMTVMASGVAFHNADLSAAERRVVEEAFRTGEVLVLVSTSTLAVGLNLPARNVFLTTEKWRYDPQLGLPWKTAVTHMEYENMGGRAGRVGMGHDFGRAILVASSPFEKELCWRRYVEGERESIVPQLARVPLEDHVLRLVAAGHCRTIRELGTFLDRTLSGQWIWVTERSGEEQASRIRAALHRCVSYRMIVALPADDGGKLVVTPCGHAVASSGVSVDTARALRDWVLGSQHRAWCDADVLYAVANTPEGRQTQVLLTSREYDEAGYVAELRERTRHESLEGELPLSRLRSTRVQPFFEEVRASKVTLFLLDWLEQVPLRVLEDRYNTMAGQIISAAAQLAWLIDAIGALASAQGLDGPFCDRLGRLATRLPLGLSEELAQLATADVLALTRTECIALGAGGFDSVDALAGAPVDQLARHVSPERAREILAWAMARYNERKRSPSDEPVSSDGDASAAPMLLIDEGRPNEITLGDRVVSLQRKQYELIRLLANFPGQCVRYETIYQTLWKDVFVEQSQMHYQKRSLLQRIQEACPGREKGLILTRSRYGYALNLAPEAVVVRVQPGVS